MRLEQFLRDSARLRGDKTALIARDMRLTYAELDSMSDRLAARLGDLGVGRGDRVLVFMDNCWEAAVSVFAIAKAGAVFSPINPSTKADKLDFIIGNCRARAVLTQARLLPVVTEANDGGELIVVSTAAGGKAPEGAVSFEECLQGSAAMPLHGGIDVDLAMLIYTSGSTGRPKGVMMTHRNIEAAAGSITTYLENTPDDIILNVLPLAFDYGLYQLIMSIKMGATLVLEKSFSFPQAIFDVIRAENVTGFPLVPTMAALILQMRDIKPGFLPSLRYVTNTAAALPPAHIARLRELFPGARLYSMYGLTECKRCTYLPPAELDRRPGSVGIAIPNTEAFVVDDLGQPVPPDTPGELVIRGPHVMQGYWENSEATNRMLRPGFNPWEKLLYTGDLFRRDAEGFLYFVGRKDDIIKTRGEKVAPKEVEAVLHACPGVAEAVVIGIPDPILGHAIGALIVLSDPNLTQREILRHCQANLEDFMVPKIIEFRSELPRTDTGKVSRRLAAESMEPTQ
ncbi:AMP-binding protein [Aminobacter sp. NyZ550]|jgi:long-chain acyl-CoA synthetase|uniref:AMP-dependent synthetase n=2 Tax=Aminobacter TaxID=31988 RepID=A0AAC9ARG8_AMIAI|nr:MULTISPECIES: AMP-binding protein [Aminobacter]AMS41639.1 AMP-dependent synthetase [Aminobacter aminovorans]MBA8904301.1 amino acid adenylation domain-containing protein [Aminobacter ciceronei]MBA9018079.1 amino acid adenylation domain-containing protein [Aminobacter ciceronei]MBB3704012.1 amino acid adenylation domain-containing protein [Aminobacter aminovorans]WAX97660.1 AMP-binding protein [Aminobacter sp. NyZ550]